MSKIGVVRRLHPDEHENRGGEGSGRQHALGASNTAHAMSMSLLVSSFYTRCSDCGMIGTESREFACVAVSRMAAEVLLVTYFSCIRERKESAAALSRHCGTPPNLRGSNSMCYRLLLGKWLVTFRACGVHIIEQLKLLYASLPKFILRHCENHSESTRCSSLNSLVKYDSPYPSP